MKRLHLKDAIPSEFTKDEQMRQLEAALFCEGYLILPDEAARDMGIWRSLKRPTSGTIIL
jgi:hypothetical protein